MVNQDKIYVGEYGRLLRFDTSPDNISTSENYTIRVQKPDDTLVEWTPVIEDSTHYTYLTQEGDIDQSGIWDIQLYLTLAPWTGFGEKINMRVHEPVPAAGP